jgi:endonuclease III
MHSYKLNRKHVARKARNIVDNTRTIVIEYGGKIPKTKKELRAMPGVGAHVSSVVLAWVHEKGEFGVDTHVDRIMNRWGFADERASHSDMEKKVKVELSGTGKIGHFSRAFVDLGQDVCGFAPDCESCFLRGSCPAAKDLEW